MVSPYQREIVAHLPFSVCYSRYLFPFCCLVGFGLVLLYLVRGCSCLSVFFYVAFHLLSFFPAVVCLLVFVSISCIRLFFAGLLCGFSGIL